MGWQTRTMYDFFFPLPVSIPISTSLLDVNTEIENMKNAVVKVSI